MKPGKARRLVTLSVMLASFLSAIEATAVTAAMPTAVGEIGSLTRYSWVFSAYLLTATTSIPMWGKLADLYGRRRLYHAAVGVFLLGSALCGTATSMEWLIVFRAVQGLGGGGVIPVASTVLADSYSLEERGRIQGLLSGVWALSSLVGPLVGGLVTDVLSWRWVFYLGIPFGILSSALLERYLPERRERRKRTLDVAGTVTLSLAVTALLLALIEGVEVWGAGHPATLGLFAAAAVGGALFLHVERGAREPMLPLDLFRIRLIAVASVGNTLLGAILFAITTFVPVWAQGARMGTAVDAGFVLTPVLIGWPVSSTLSARWMLRVGYRRVAVTGALSCILGGLLLATVGAATPKAQVFAAMGCFGLGLGSLSMPYLIGVQNAVAWGRRGVASSTIQFFRSIGGAISVAALGALMNARWDAAGGPALGVEPDRLLDPALRDGLGVEQVEALASALLAALTGPFRAVVWLGIASLVVALRLPRGTAASLAHPSQVSEPDARRPPPEPRD